MPIFAGPPAPPGPAATDELAPERLKEDIAKDIAPAEGGVKLTTAPFVRQRPKMPDQAPSNIPK